MAASNGVAIWNSRVNVYRYSFKQTWKYVEDRSICSESSILETLAKFLQILIWALRWISCYVIEWLSELVDVVWYSDLLSQFYSTVKYCGPIRNKKCCNLQCSERDDADDSRNCQLPYDRALVWSWIRSRSNQIRNIGFAMSLTRNQPAKHRATVYYTSLFL